MPNRWSGVSHAQNSPCKAEYDIPSMEVLICPLVMVFSGVFALGARQVDARFLRKLIGRICTVRPNWDALRTVQAYLTRTLTSQSGNSPDCFVNKSAAWVA